MDPNIFYLYHLQKAKIKTLLLNPLQASLALLMITSYLFKVTLHQELDRKNDYPRPGWSSFERTDYLLPYDKKVKPEFEKKKKICNILQNIFGYSILALLISGVLRLIFR